MGTKNAPGRFDGYAKAAPDEPVFMLLGRDPCAAVMVDLWIALRVELGDDAHGEHLQDARWCALALEAWAAKLGKEGLVQKARRALRRVIYGS